MVSTTLDELQEFAARTAGPRHDDFSTQALARAVAEVRAPAAGAAGGVPSARGRPRVSVGVRGDPGPVGVVRSRRARAHRSAGGPSLLGVARSVRADRVRARRIGRGVPSGGRGQAAARDRPIPPPGALRAPPARGGPEPLGVGVHRWDRAAAGPAREGRGIRSPVRSRPVLRGTAALLFGPAYPTGAGPAGRRPAARPARRPPADPPPGPPDICASPTPSIRTYLRTRSPSRAPAPSRCSWRRTASLRSTWRR